MTIEEAIRVAVEMNVWRRREDDMPEPMPHAPREFGEAIDTLVEHAKRTTWQPIETAPEALWVLIAYSDDDGLRECTMASSYSGQWVSADGWVCQCVTHWMPLPQHPKENK